MQSMGDNYAAPSKRHYSAALSAHNILLRLHTFDVSYMQFHTSNASYIHVTYYTGGLCESLHTNYPAQAWQVNDFGVMLCLGDSLT